MLTSVDYDRAFMREVTQVYPKLEKYLLDHDGYFLLNTPALLEAARVLACPVKANPPNWQHGHLVYHLARTAIARAKGAAVYMLDIGTAKGFSALMMQWALEDACAQGQVYSVDVIDPAARVQRNTVAEVCGLKTLREILSPWPEANKIDFLQSTGADFLKATSGRIHFAFVDGKHNCEQVLLEGRIICGRQAIGDLVLFDDVHIPGVAEAVSKLPAEAYKKEYLSLIPNRREYCICERV